MTVVEMICSKVCLTSMICFSLEAKFRNECTGQNLFDSQVHMVRHRIGARGNATSFPMPWQDILTELEKRESAGETQVAPDLPRVGSELADVVQILLKTNEEDSPESMATFIHQALVRRSVVVKLIEDAKKRGHRAYRLIDIEAMHKKSRMLPEKGVPPEILRVLPHDDHLDRIQVQKAATPIGGRGDLAGAANELSQTIPNAVVLEKSSQEQADINAQRMACLRGFAERLQDGTKRFSR